MTSWFSYFKHGMTREMPKDRISADEAPKELRDNLRMLVPFVKRHWKKGIPGLLLIIWTSLLAFPQPLITRYLIDHVLLEKALALLLPVVLLVVAISALSALSGLLQGFYFTRFEQRVVLDIQDDLFDRVLRFPKSFFDETQTGYLMARLNSDVQGLRWFFSSTMVHIVSNILRFIGGVAFLFYLEWRLAAVVLFALPPIVFIVRYFSRRMYVLSRHQMEKRAEVSSRMQESIASVPLIKAFSSEEQTKNGMIDELKAAFTLNLEQSTVGSVAGLAINSLPSLARILVLGVGGFFVIRGEWTLGSLLAFQSYLGYVFGPARFLAGINLRLQNARASLERVSALFDIVPEDNLGTGRPVDNLKGEVQFDDVSFSYGVNKPVLEHVSFHARPGEHWAIVGPSGVGKTTLISLILRFYRPSSGRISFDGEDADIFELSSLRKRIGYVSQATLLLSGTVGENVRYGNPDASDGEVARALRVAGLEEFIASLPDKLDTKLGEKGVNFSEGQKQRLSIARALLKDPDILVLDEPTSALDTVIEKSIFDSLPAVMREKTLFVVAHRISTIQDSDHIVVLNHGRIEAIGTHDALLKSSPYYRSVVSGQRAEELG